MISSNEQEGRPTREELGRFLLDTGAMDLAWRDAFQAVDRSAFLPEVMWPHDMTTGRTVTVIKSQDPGTWYGYADADVPVVTQWDDGQHEGTKSGRASTSSASMPSVVFAMLGDLDVGSGQRVLEVGTGSGCNAALLAHRLGARNVVSVEVDGAVAAAADDALVSCGLPVEVVTGDGFFGYPEGGPYDRAIATCGLRRVPFAWVEQTRPGGVIVAPWGTHYSHRDAVVRLTVCPDGTVASGPFTRPVQFMKLRSQRLPWAGHGQHVPDDVIAHGEESFTTLTEEAFPTGAFEAVPFAVGLWVRDCWHSVAEKRGDTRPVWFYGLADASWAVVIFKDGEKEATVYQSGPRRLWDEVESAYRWWEGENRPALERFGLTVTAEGQTAWLDDPGNGLGPVG